MSQEVRKLEPQALWNHFADLNEVPRPSKKEQRVIEFMRQFGDSLGLETTVDDTGNVLIRKPASSGKEDRTTVILQSHLDMVHQKNADTVFDFESQGIQMNVADDWVQAKGTTLGADNGIGVASIMTILASTEIQHPPIEALFTVDEETGMTGAQGLQGGLLNGKILLNLDTEDDDVLTIGCAGGVDVTASDTYDAEPLPNDHVTYQIAVTGLTGGHSGVDIHSGRANSNKLMNRLLWMASKKFSVRIHSIDGGGLRNAIPRESTAIIAIPHKNEHAFLTGIESAAETIQQEYATTDPQLRIAATAAESTGSVVPLKLQSVLLGAIYACPNGIHRLSPDIDDLVQTSNNLARVIVADGRFKIACLTRSSVDSERDDLARAILACLELTGARVDSSGAYPGWKPAPESKIVQQMSDLYQTMFGEPIQVLACHAGLECGILGTNYPGLDMVSFGPNIRGAHSPDEKVQISSVQKYWKFLLETLRTI